MNIRNNTSQNCSIINSNCLWYHYKASTAVIAKYNNVLNRLRNNIDIDCELFTCSNCHCSLDNHKRDIDNLCNFIIQSCLSAHETCIPLATTGARLEGSDKTRTRTATVLALVVVRDRKDKFLLYI